MPPFFPQGFCSCSISIDIRTKATIIGPLVETLLSLSLHSSTLACFLFPFQLALHSSFYKCCILLATLVVRKSKRRGAIEVSSPVTIQSVNTHPTIETRAAGIGGTRLMDSVPGSTGADSADGGRHRDQGHAPCIHHCRDVAHNEVVCTTTALATVRAPTFIHVNL